MVIELSGVQFGLQSFLWFPIELAPRDHLILNFEFDMNFRRKLQSTQFSYHFITSNFIFHGNVKQSFGIKSCNVRMAGSGWLVGTVVTVALKLFFITTLSSSKSCSRNDQTPRSANSMLKLDKQGINAQLRWKHTSSWWRYKVYSPPRPLGLLSMSSKDRLVSCYWFSTSPKRFRTVFYLIIMDS